MPAIQINILQSAIDDILLGFEFYELQSNGLGAYFIDSIFSDIDSLILYGGTHKRCFGKFYRALSKRFPFAIYYTMEKNEIKVYAVLDCRQHPDKIFEKLKDKTDTQ